MMGMGEPLLNFDNVVAAMDLMLEDLAYGLSKRRVTLSTSGVVPALDRLAEVSEVSLAVPCTRPMMHYVINWCQSTVSILLPSCLRVAVIIWRLKATKIGW